MDDKGRRDPLTSPPPAGFDYPSLVLESLRGMVRGLIERVAEEGFPGDHNFLLTFGTREPGVVISARLLKRFPEEMTIVLQHQFWNLRVHDDAVQVTLRFGGVPESLTVPLAALRAFADPSAGFGLRLQALDEPASESVAADHTEAQPVPTKEAPDSETPAPASQTARGNVLAFNARRRGGKGKA